MATLIFVLKPKQWSQALSNQFPKPSSIVLHYRECYFRNNLSQNSTSNYCWFQISMLANIQLVGTAHFKSFRHWLWEPAIHLSHRPIILFVKGQFTTQQIQCTHGECCHNLILHLCNTVFQQLVAVCHWKSANLRGDIWSRTVIMTEGWH